MKKTFGLFLVLFFLSALINPCFAGLFKKKTQVQKPKMVETKQEWEIEAQNIPVDERNNQLPKKEDDKKMIIPKPHYVFEKYNYPQGKRKLNIEHIKKSLYSYPYIISDVKCKYVVYPRYYYTPGNNQISSEIYVGKLDTSKTRTKRFLEYNHNQKIRRPIIESGTKEVYPNLFKGLTVVDWSKDSSKILIKEQVGSLLNGIYKTYLYVYFMPDDINNGYAVKLIDFDDEIKYYFDEAKNLKISHYRYDIEPLGFSSDDENVIVAHCYIYDKNNKKIFMGTWGYNLLENKTILISEKNPVFPISVNGLILKQILD